MNVTQITHPAAINAESISSNPVSAAAIQTVSLNLQVNVVQRLTDLHGWHQAWLAEDTQLR